MLRADHIRHSSLAAPTGQDDWRHCGGLIVWDEFPELDTRRRRRFRDPGLWYQMRGLSDCLSFRFRGTTRKRTVGGLINACPTKPNGKGRKRNRWTAGSPGAMNCRPRNGPIMTGNGMEQEHWRRLVPCRPAIPRMG